MNGCLHTSKQHIFLHFYGSSPHLSAVFFTMQPSKGGTFLTDTPELKNQKVYAMMKSGRVFFIA